MAKNINYTKGFVDIYTKNTNLKNIKWDKFNRFALITIHTHKGKYQIYPHNIMEEMVNHYDLTEYNRRSDGKRYFSSGIHSNGFTPTNIVGTVRGNYEEFCKIVDIILEYRENQICNRMNEILNNEKLDFDFNDFNYASIIVKDVKLMENEDDILKNALNVWKEFNIEVDYEWDYDAGDEYWMHCDLDFRIKKE
jgi:hypothetical protein